MVVIIGSKLRLLPRPYGRGFVSRIEACGCADRRRLPPCLPDGIRRLGVASPADPGLSAGSRGAWVLLRIVDRSLRSSASPRLHALAPASIRARLAARLPSGVGSE